MGKKKDKSKKGKGAEKTALKTEKNVEKKMKKALKATGEVRILCTVAVRLDLCHSPNGSSFSV